MWPCSAVVVALPVPECYDVRMKWSCLCSAILVVLLGPETRDVSTVCESCVDRQHYSKSDVTKKWLCPFSALIAIFPIPKYRDVPTMWSSLYSFKEAVCTFSHLAHP